MRKNNKIGIRFGGLNVIKLYKKEIENLIPFFCSPRLTPSHPSHRIEPNNISWPLFNLYEG